MGCALRAGLGQQTIVHCVADGAPWIALQVERVFGAQGTFLIDFYHLCEKFTAAAPSCAPEDPDAWIKTQARRMKTNTTLEDLPTPSQVGKTRVGGLDINQRRIRAVIEAVMALAWYPRGFTAREVATRVEEILRQTYQPRQAACDLKKLRGKHLVEKIAKSHRYQPTSEGLRALAGLMVLRDKVLQPLLAGCGKRKSRRKPKNQHPLDPYYEAVQREMQHLFGALNIAA